MELSVQQEGDWAWARVRDHGTGVDPDDVARLTQRFARDRRGDGTRRVGLGLALVTQIVRSHSGRLDVSHTPGGGATFALVLPLSPPFDDATSARPRTTGDVPDAAVADVTVRADDVVFGPITAEGVSGRGASVAD